MSQLKIITHTNEAIYALVLFVEKAEKELAPDAYRVLESSATKVLATYERAIQQMYLLNEQYVRLEQKSKSRAGTNLYPFRTPPKKPRR